MRIYLSPANDAAHAADTDRLADRNEVLSLVLAYAERITVQDVVYRLSNPRCKGLLVPDDYHRHSPLIEHVKACAYHMGMDVQPITRYLAKPSPAAAPAHAHAVGAGEGNPIVREAAG
jgi:hypothetical protein